MSDDSFLNEINRHRKLTTDNKHDGAALLTKTVKKNKKQFYS